MILLVHIALDLNLFVVVVNVEDLLIPIFSTKYTVSPGTPLTGDIPLEDGLGKKAQFIFDYSTQLPSVTLTEPSGTHTYTQTSKYADDNSAFNILTITLEPSEVHLSLI